MPAATEAAVAIETALGLAAVLLLTIGTGFFVAGEFALVAADRPRIEELAEQGDRSARSAVQALKTLAFQLSGAQLGITVTSLIVGFIAEPTIAEALKPLIEGVGVSEESIRGVSIVIALVIATAGQMVIGELIPKNLALARPADLALWISTPLRLFNTAARPLIVFLNASANVTVRLLGIEPRDELASAHSLEELEILIRSSREEGALREEEYSLLSRSIGFPDKTAADALVPRTSMKGVAQTATIGELIALAVETGRSRFPVFGEDLDDIVGLAHVKDTYSVPRDRRAATPVAEIMSDPLITPESRGLDALLREMRSSRKQLAVVIDEYGGTAGIITLEDILEEIVGEIDDEHDPGVPQAPLTSSPDGISVVSGMLHPDEVQESTGFEMPEGDYETLAGFLLSVFDRIPEQGDHCAYDGWEFKVVKMEGRRIARVLVVGPAKVPEGDRR